MAAIRFCAVIGVTESTFTTASPIVCIDFIPPPVLSLLRGVSPGSPTVTPAPGQTLNSSETTAPAPSSPSRASIPPRRLFIWVAGSTGGVAGSTRFVAHSVDIGDRILLTAGSDPAVPPFTSIGLLRAAPLPRAGRPRCPGRPVPRRRPLAAAGAIDTAVLRPAARPRRRSAGRRESAPSGARVPEGPNAVGVRERDAARARRRRPPRGGKVPGGKRA